MAPYIPAAPMSGPYQAGSAPYPTPNLAFYPPASCGPMVSHPSLVPYRIYTW